MAGVSFQENFPATFLAYFHGENPVEDLFPSDYSGDSNRSGEEEEEDDSNELPNHEEKAQFWEAKYRDLEEILACRSGSSESKLRSEVINAVESAREVFYCACLKPSSKSCASCLHRAVVDWLCAAGYNAALSISKWKSNKDIPGGEHEYLDVVIPTRQKKEVRYIIELEFRGEFEMARAGELYQKLVSQLPELYVGKPEKLHSILHVVCNAGKRAMKEKKMHMGPWRKRKFMQMKWLSSYRRVFSGSVAGGSGRKEGADGSVPSFGLLDNAPRLCFPVVRPVAVA